MACCKRKDYDTSLQLIKQALDLDKKNAKAFHALGLTYSEIGDFPRALECLSNAVGLSPQTMEFNISLAIALEKAGLVDEADMQYQKICSDFRSNLESFLIYSSFLHKNHRQDKALVYLSHARQLAPNNLDIIDQIGFVYLELGDVDMAISQFKNALSAEPQRISSLKGIEQALQDAGRQDEANELCDRIIEIDPNRALGYLLKSRITRSGSEDSLAEDLTRVSLLDNVSDSTKIEINYALGKIYDDRKDYGHAFEHYQFANNLRNKETVQISV